jgi:hypothetical protein
MVAWQETWAMVMMWTTAKQQVRRQFVDAFRCRLSLLAACSATELASAPSS